MTPKRWCGAVVSYYWEFYRKKTCTNSLKLQNNDLWCPLTVMLIYFDTRSDDHFEKGNEGFGHEALRARDNRHINDCRTPYRHSAPPGRCLRHCPHRGSRSSSCLPRSHHPHLHTPPLHAPLGQEPAITTSSLYKVYSLLASFSLPKCV